MSTLRGGRRDAPRWFRRRRWFGGLTLLMVGVAMAGILRSPRAGLELTDVGPGPLSPAEAATTSVEPAAGASSLAPPETAATLPIDTAVVVAAEPTPESMAASDLESFFVAIEGRDYVGAFDHLSARHQADVGGYPGFEAVWRAASVVAHDPAGCSADDQAFECTITFRTYDADGACLGGMYSYRVQKLGSRHSIVEERPIAERSCPPLATTTTLTTG